MGRVETVAMEKRTINHNVNSASTLSSLPNMFPNLHFIQANRKLEIPQPSETGKFINIFGIPVTIEIDEDAIIVTDYIVHMYGVGNTLQEAIEDYKISIKAYREELLEDEDRLNSNLKQHLYYLYRISKYLE